MNLFSKFICQFSAIIYQTSLYLSATLYFIPSFSISAITQSVIYGIPVWNKIAGKMIYHQYMKKDKIIHILILNAW